MQHPPSRGCGSSLSWFAVHVLGSEFQVEADLIALSDMAGLSIDAYCPAITKWTKKPESLLRQRNHVPARIQLPLYPEYLFVGLGADSSGELPFRAVIQTTRVLGLLGAAGAPIEVPYDLPDPEFTRLLARKADVPWSVFGLRVQQRAGLFDFTVDRKRAAAALRKAQLSFRSFADFGAFVTKGEMAA